ncbi:MAG TPA: hypothetical protein PKN93_00860 [Leptospiraceae bacterium]|nr:hypothetical protein [Leptospiraceae bacterium]HNN73175.1 hypothetical protein [Leptospiraceae bacterium]
MPVFVALICAILVYVYMKTGHGTSRAFRNICFVEFFAATLIATVSPRWRFVFAGFATLTLSRLPSLLLQIPTHNLLFPIFFGLALGAYFRAARNDLSEPVARFGVAQILAVAIIIGCVRAILQNYWEPGIGLVLENRILSDQMTSNYAVFLALTLGLHLLAPIVWICVEQVNPELEAGDMASRLSIGILWGIGANLIVMLLQGFVSPLNTGITDRAIEAGRRAGLFSDSGSAGAAFLAFVLPASFAFASLFHARIKKNKRWLASLLFFWAIAIFTASFFGRVIVLASVGALVAWLFLIPLNRRVRLIAGFAILFSFVCFGLFLIWSGPVAFLSRIDPVRAQLLETGIVLIRQSPWLGHGFNSFVPALMELRKSDPTILIENPAGLIPGILNDAGIVGLCILVAMLVYYVLGLRLLFLRKGADENAAEATVVVILSTLSMFLVFTVGYHILAAEVAAFVFFPLLVLPDSFRRTKS